MLQGSSAGLIGIGLHRRKQPVLFNGDAFGRIIVLHALAVLHQHHSRLAYGSMPKSAPTAPMHQRRQEIEPSWPMARSRQATRRSAQARNYINEATTHNAHHDR